MIKIIFSEFQGMSAGMMMRNSFNQHQPGIPNLHPVVHELTSEQPTCLPLSLSPTE